MKKNLKKKNKIVPITKNGGVFRQFNISMHVAITEVVFIFDAVAI